MATLFPEISFPEIFVGFVAPIGADVAGCVKEFKQKFERLSYNVVEIKVTDIFPRMARFIKPGQVLEQRP